MAGNPPQLTQSFRRFFPGGDFRFLLGLDQVLGESSQEELKLLLGQSRGEGIPQVVLVGMVLGRIFTPPFAFGDDVMLKCNRVFVALHDDQFPHRHARWIRRES